MNYVDIISRYDVPHFVDNLWISSYFKNSNHPFFIQLKNALKIAPLFLAEYTNEKQRNHLVSHLRVIPIRSYQNKIIQDLYYLHELCHAAEFKGYACYQFEKWKDHLNHNEFYASIISEAFIYLFIPEIKGLTFDHLWIDMFDFKNELASKHHNDINWLDFSTSSNYPDIYRSIIARRHELRNIQDVSHLSNAEAKIVNYNVPREAWLNGWQSHFMDINNAIYNLLNYKINPLEYLEILKQNQDIYGRPFFPKM